MVTEPCLPRNNEISGNFSYEPFQALTAIRG